MTRKSLARWSLVTLLGLLPTILPATETITVRQTALEKESVQLINQIEGISRAVHYKTDTLAMMSRGDVTQWTHHDHLNEIKILINEGLNPAMMRLTELQPELPEWKQKVIGQMLTSARNLAADTNSAILTLNDNGRKPIVLNGEYRDLVSGINGHAQVLVRTADAAGSYAAAYNQALDAGLNLPEHP